MGRAGRPWRSLVLYNTAEPALGPEQLAAGLVVGDPVLQVGWQLRGLHLQGKTRVRLPRATRCHGDQQGWGGRGDSQAVVFTRLDLGSHRSPAPAPPRRPSSPPSSRGTMPLLRPVSPTGWQLSPLHIPRSGAKTSEASWLEAATGDPERPEAGQGMEGKKRRQSGSARRAQDRAMPEAPSQRANRSQTPPRSSAPGSCALLLSHTSRLPANSATIL